jgi:hypothetical protein
MSKRQYRLEAVDSAGDVWRFTIAATSPADAVTQAREFLRKRLARKGDTRGRTVASLTHTPTQARRQPAPSPPACPLRRQERHRAARLARPDRLIQ